MNATDLISAKMEGESFETILKIVREESEAESSLSEDHRDFLESMLSEVKKATSEFENAFKSENPDELRKVSKSFIEIFQMIDDSCDS